MMRPYYLLALLLLACDGPEPQPGPSGRLDLDAPAYFGPFTEPEDNLTTYEGVALGRTLFYDPILSEDGTLSCASCHQQAHAFADTARYSRGVHGRLGLANAMALGNVLWESRFFWNGREASLEAQALVPIQDTLELNLPLAEAVARLQADADYPTAFEAAFGSPQITAERMGQALAQFQRTLISDSSRYDQYLLGTYTPTAQELQGMELFFTHPEPSQGLRGANCGDCHLGPRTAGSPVGFKGFSNNGLDADADLAPGLLAVTGDPTDRGKFKIPSLRNVALTAPYMHDGRFATLEAVIDHYNEHVQPSETLDVLIRAATNLPEGNQNGVQLGLTEEEKAALLAFLNMLTDEQLVTNEAYADPSQE